MRPTKWMRSAVLTTAAMAVAGVIAVVACGPASPAGQSGSGGGKQEQPTATPYPDDCREVLHPMSGELITVCPEPGSRKIDGNLRREYNAHMEKKATRQARGEEVPAIQRMVIIRVSTHDAVDAVVDYLEARTSNPMSGYKDSGAGGRVIGVVDIELLPALAERDDVVEIDLEIPPAPASLMRQSSSPTPTPTLTALEHVRADQWHDAGVTGSGVQVGVIDFDFRDFRTRVADPAVVNSDPTRPDVYFLCFNAAGVATHTDFTFCETSPVSHLNPGLSPHGTDVSVVLMENAPDATLLISNPRGMKQLEQAVDWMTLGTADNAATDVDYNNACDAGASDVVNAGCNDDFDVKVINHSYTYTWDGPGDGTSPFFSRGERSPINIAGDAVSRGVVWLNAAGNQEKATWFGRSFTFSESTSTNSKGRLNYGGGSPFDCNAFDVGSDSPATIIQVRWSADWGRADIDLDLEVYGPTKREGFSTDPQSGGSGHYPRETVTFPAGALSPGTYCVAVTKDMGDPNVPDDGEDDPDWIQVQVFAGSGEFRHVPAVGGHSISNPAESASRGLLAVGAAENNSMPPPPLALWESSARGPLPSTGYPRKPDVVGLNTDMPGTSFASPRVAGVAALIVQGGGGLASVTKVSGAIREHAEHPTSSHVDHEWGHGFSKLPSLESPVVASVSHDPCNSQGALSVNYSHPAVGTHPMAFQMKAKQVSVHGTGVAAYETTHISTIRMSPREVFLDTGTDRGSYDVTARACTESGHCGPESTSPMRVTTTAKVCKPRWFQAVAGDEQVTLWWNPDPDATGYSVELVGGSSRTVTGTEHVIEGLVNGGLYEYVLRSLGPGGPSDPTSPRSVTPRESASRPPIPTNLRVESNISRRFLGTMLRWDAPLGSYLYEVRVLGGGADTWKRLPFQPAGWDAPYSARYFGGHQRVGDSNVLVGDAIVAGLIPGTDYHFAVRAARKRNSSEQLDYSPWSEVVTLTTPGTRPANAPGSATAPALKAPPEDLMAEVSGTTVNLTWTATTNPEYVCQEVLRRVIPGGDWDRDPVGIADTSHEDTGLTSGTTYRYRVRAYKGCDANGYGTGNYGEEVGGWADAVIP